VSHSRSTILHSTPCASPPPGPSQRLQDRSSVNHIAHPPRPHEGRSAYKLLVYTAEGIAGCTPASSKHHITTTLTDAIRIRLRADAGPATTATRGHLQRSTHRRHGTTHVRMHVRTSRLLTLLVAGGMSCVGRAWCVRATLCTRRRRGTMCQVGTV
jgi:hypothetical protein